MHARSRLVTGSLLVAALFVPVWANASEPTPPPADKLHPMLEARLEEEPVTKAWVFFRDKGFADEQARSAALSRVAHQYNRRAVQRRQMRSVYAKRGEAVIRDFDLPVAPAYVQAVTATGADVHVKSSWLNAISVEASREQLEAIAALPYVDRLEAVRRSYRRPDLNVQDLGSGPFPTQGARGARVDYGNSAAQLNQINLVNLHNAGYTGQGVIIGILDTGFKRTHVAFNNPAKPLNVIAEWDFVDDDGNTGQEAGDPFDQHRHGTLILGCIGAYQPGSLVGGAYDASFVLCKTEDTTQEVPAEEDDYVAGLQFIESHGADMSTASLGYVDWYTQAQLDGQTAVTTIAMNIHTSLGVHHCNAAGNEGHDSNPATSHLIAPADGYDVITCGAATSTGSIASFSSDGPTADGRVKPEVLARGVSTHTVSASSDTSYTTADGTSLSTPVVACAIACLVQAKPYWTVDDMRQHLFETADYYVANGTYDPTYVRGYGMVNAYAAYDTCDDAGALTLDRTAYQCDGVLTLLVNDCGLNTDDAVIETVTINVASDTEPAGESIVLTETQPDSAEFLGTAVLQETDAAGVVQVTSGDTVTATYVDADNGAGGIGIVVTATAIVDCTAPLLSNVQTTIVGPRNATIVFAADEPVQGTVRYGVDCNFLNFSQSSGNLSTNTSVTLTGLDDDTTYYYAVEGEDAAGNVTVDDNGGACYSFTTPEVPDYFAEQFTSGFDLDYQKVAFTPNGSIDFYAVCVEGITAFPTDPTGGTPLSPGEDGSSLVQLTGGATVSLYGAAYSSFHVGSNGYLTFGASDGDYTETFEDHFNTPRVSIFFDDFSPQNGTGVSWIQLADRVVVTYLNVPEYTSTGSNSFQAELYFDGRIVLSYAGMTASDGIVGLSDGSGVSPDFVPADLSGEGPCQSAPPTATDVAAACERGGTQAIDLAATDDGLPYPPGALSYMVTQLPTYGTLYQIDGAEITTVPHVLPLGRRVQYEANIYYTGVDSFAFMADDGGAAPDGGLSNEATVSVTISVAPYRVHNFPLDSDPGWATDGDWAFGVPVAGGSHAGDPVAARSGDYIYGYELGGDYRNQLSPQYLTTTPIDCSAVSNAALRFWRWLGVEHMDVASVAVSADGLSWTELWHNSPTDSLNDTAWVQQAYDISAVADGAATVYLRWQMGPTDNTVTFPGWSIDDVEIWGLAPVLCAGDTDCDGDVDFDDIVHFVRSIGDDGTAWAAGYTAQYGTAPACSFANADLDGDGDCDFDDIAPFVERIPADCR
jgi:serine protease AprX